MRIIGLMSGTSMDGIDAALLETDGLQTLHAGPASSYPYDDKERAFLAKATQAALSWNFKGTPPHILQQAEDRVTQAHSRAIRRFMASYPDQTQRIDLIGFHGQTVLHRPPENNLMDAKNNLGGSRQKIPDRHPPVIGRTLQLGDGVAMAQALGIRVVYDFRSADMAAGGQGAPLVPVYHAALARRDGLPLPLVILNLGGVANITFIDAKAGLMAGDVGPGNGLLDAWTQACGLGPMDFDGRLAQAGQVDETALARWLNIPFFAQDFPKSADRWDFGNVDEIDMSPENGAASLTAFTARSVALALGRLSSSVQLVLVGGGGRHNPALMASLVDILEVNVKPVEAVGWRGDALEAEAFAYLAARSVKGLPLTFPETTGVASPITGGRLSPVL